MSDTDAIELHKTWQQRVRDCLKILSNKNNTANHTTARRELLKIGLMVDKAIATKGFKPNE